ncbi:tetratricopeptide repeat protein [Streptomyces rubiginosohelvolus]|uniref:AfsR/SARP family transcriptional regulator n=1 Tax=Streptomyces rubiginosohelvolus TaxID=67362 RepID=UPI0033BBFF5A
MEFRILGPITLHHDGVQLEIGSDKERCLIAALSLSVGRPVALSTLIEILWDGNPPIRARENIHSYISRTRRRLRSGAPAHPREPAEPVPGITGHAHTYTLECAPESIDWYSFQRLCTEAYAASDGGDDRRAVILLGRAEELWSGEALAGLPGLWAERTRGVLAEKRLTAALARIAASLRLDRYVDLIGELSELADRHPGDETVVGYLMLACYGSGRHSDALRVHQRARQTLRAEFGSSPGPDLDRIHRGILDRRPVQELVRGDATGVPPASFAGPPASSRARSAFPTDGARADRPLPSAPPSAPAPDTPAAPTPAPTPVPVPVPQNLPRQPPLIGRHAELHQLSAAVRRATEAEHGPIVTLETISGMAGVGKTALAVHAARRFADRFPDGLLYLDLRAHSATQEPVGPAAALGILLRLLGAPARTIPPGIEERTALWRTMLAERRSIIVLDDAADPDQVRPLLPSGSPSLTLITSRRRLTGLPDALPVPLDALPADDAIALFRSFAGSDRTQNLRAVAEIVRLCGYLPLAIELIANRFRAHTSWSLGTVTQKLARSAGRLGEIRDGYQEMEHVFAVSYQTLTGAQRRAFRYLSLHPGAEFSQDAAGALCGLPAHTAERLIESLLGYHLLQEPSPYRYRFHDLIAEFARSRSMAEDGETDREAALERLITFYTRSAARADRLAYPRRIPPADGYEGDAGAVDVPAPRAAPANRDGAAPDAAAARAWFMEERGNLLATERYARTRERPDLATRLGQYLASFLDTECHWVDAGHINAHIAAYGERVGDRAARCRALLYLSTAHANTGRYPQATEAGQEALSIARTTGDTRAEAEARRLLGVFAWHVGDNRTALAMMEKSFALKSASGDIWDIAQGHNNIAIILLALGKNDSALGHFQQAVSLFRSTGDRRSLGTALSNIGDLHLRIENMSAARDPLQEALILLDSAGNRYEQATVRTNLAEVLTFSGDHTEALPLYLDALAAFRALGDRKSQANTLNGLGELHRSQGRHDRAIECHREALALARAIGAAREEAQAHHRLGRAELALGNSQEAIDHFEAAVATADRTQDVNEGARFRETLTRALSSNGSNKPSRLTRDRRA